MSNLNSLAQIALDLHGIERAPERVEEIAIETKRLLSGLSSINVKLDYYDEPLDYTVMLRKEAGHG